MQHSFPHKSHTESQEERGFFSAVKRVWRVLSRILRRADEHHIYLAASGIAFNILIFILPTMLVMVFVIGIFIDRTLVIGAIEDFLLEVLPPDGGLDATIDIVKSEINHVLQNSGSAAWIGIPALFWVSLALFGSIRTALNAVFGFRHEKTFWAAVGRDSFLLMLFVLAILLSNAAPRLALSAADWATATVWDGYWLRMVVSNMVSMTVIYLFFVSLYSFTPNRLPPISVILSSALFSVIFWQCARFGFGFYVKNFATYGKVYGIYGAAVAVAFWVYYSALVILFSGELGQYWYESRRRRKLESKHSTVFAKASDALPR
ncbi:MAG: YihY/virulence factor BrkB family protein [Candidatus Kapabacteria bacterium]|nr:YihY/virulence factor BrkB family protein [Candidatus Kapabacteria bacterium]